MSRQKGLILLIIAILVIGAGIGGFLVYQKRQEAPPAQQFQPPQDQMPGGSLMNHNTYITFSEDGKTWGQSSLVRKSASVPDLIQLTEDLGEFKKGGLLIYFVDALAMTGPGTEQLGILYSPDLGKSWQERGHIALSGKKNKGGAVDPSVVQLSDGSLRLYFFGSEITSGDPAKQEGKHKIYSARSFDGIHFTVEEGIRFEDNTLTDPEVIYFQDKWFMYYSAGPSSRLAISTDGLNFEAVSITGGDIGGVPGALALDNGVRIFGCGRGLSSAISADGLHFTLEQTDIRDSSNKGLGCDPAAIRLSDGRYAMIHKMVEGGTPHSQFPQQEEGEIIFTGAKYKTVASKPLNGWFRTGQDADIVLSAVDFNNAGGPLLFNHPGNVASDGTHLLLADRNNNRILIWNTLPDGNTPPDLVLGQQNFTTNNPGTGLDSLNWPVAVAAFGGKVVVGDTYNDRILIWNSFPTRNGQPADIELKGPPPRQLQREERTSASKRMIGWPWAVWTNGEKLVVASTGTSSVLIWNRFPTENSQPADIVLFGNDNFGTPRAIASDGKHLMIGDHNAKVSGGGGNYFWKTFPTADDQLYDFFVAEPGRMGEVITPKPEGPKPSSGSALQLQGPPPGGGVMWGGMTSDGKLVGITNMLSIWNTFPENENDGPELQVGSVPGREGYDFGGRQSGDGTGIAAAGGRLYVSLSNGNKIIGFNSFPTRADQKPDFAIGAPDIETDTLATNYFITNGVPATDGKSLFVSSDFDRKLYVWKNLPDESGADPDIIYPYGGWDNELYGSTFAMANQKELYIWKTLPTDGRKPDITARGSIGSVQFQELRGVAIDEKYFYLADASADKVYVFEGIPDEDSNPKFTLSIDQPRRLSSDGKYLVVATTLDNQTGHIKIYTIAELSNNAKPKVLDRRVVPTNLPEHAVAAGGSFFIGDTPHNRVLAWRNIEDAVNGKAYDVILGESNAQDMRPELGRNKLFWPAGLAFDGSYLWVGEFKFGNRLLRYSIGQ